MISDNKTQKNITQAELDSLKQVTSIDEWSNVVKGIKRKRNGKMPPDWQSKVIDNGIIKVFQDLNDTLKASIFGEDRSLWH